MNRRLFGVIFVIIGLVVLTVGVYGFAFSTTLQTQTKTLAASDGVSVQLELGQGDTAKGTLVVLDGNEGVAAYVENPAKEVVYNGGTVYSMLEFSFSAQTAGSYTVNFENLSSANQQIIEYSLTYSAVPWLVSLLAAIIGVLLFASGVVLAILPTKHH